MKVGVRTVIEDRSARARDLYSAAMRNDRPKVVAASVIGLVAGVALTGYAVVGLSGGSAGSFLWLLVGCFALFFGVVLAVALTKDPSTNGGDGDGKTMAHALEFEVGAREKHTVQYRWDQVWGWLTVTIDEVPVVKQFVLFTFRLLSAVEFEVGQHEKHVVRIEKRRPLVASFARPQPLEAFVDGARISASE